eukprot:13667657-Heterocapsa_arctica.AAC.1
MKKAPHSGSFATSASHSATVARLPKNVACASHSRRPACTLSTYPPGAGGADASAADASAGL